MHDISSAGDLLRYALGAQLELLLDSRDHLSKNKIAYAAGMGNRPTGAGSNLSALLRNTTPPTVEMLQRLDRAITASAPAEELTGGLASLAVRLSDRQQDPTSLIAVVPPSWGRQMLREHAETETAVLSHASALLSAFRTASKLGRGRSVDDVRLQHRERLEELVQQLIRIAVGPPTPRNIDAQILLGSLASYAVDSTLRHLEHELRSGPMGFRVWRVITKLVKLSGDNGPYSRKLQVWVHRLLGEANTLRDDSLYAGRSLDLELAITVPPAWSPPGNDWVHDALLDRALNRRATIRERGTAAMGLWQRAVAGEGRDLGATEEELRRLIEGLRDAAARPDAATGIRWVAATLEHVIDNKVAVCNDWPQVDEPWIHHVREAANELDDSEIPPHLLTGTKRLFTHALLQNAGVLRRQAVETLVTGGWIEPVTRAMGRMLDLEENEAWIRIRAEFALGFMQCRERHVEASLKKACEHAYEKLARTDHRPTRAQVTEMHATLFAIGDCFGAANAEDRARSARDGIRDVLRDLVLNGRTEPRDLHLVARATAYVLTVTAQPRHNGGPDLSEELLERLRTHPDPVTSNFSGRALESRFGELGAVRPLLSVALS